MTVWHQSHAIIIFISICAIVVLAVAMLHWGVKKILRLLRRGKSHRVVLLRKNWQKILVIALTLFMLYCIESIFLMPKEYSKYYYHLLALLVIVFLTWVVVQILYSVRDRMFLRVDKDVVHDMSMRAARTKLNILLKIAVFAVVVIGISVALMTFPTIHEIGVSILASAGIAGVIVGFAAQKSLGNLFAGIQIALTQPIRIDDVVVVDNEMGNIEEISLTYVVVRLWDKRRLVVPITYFVEKVFQNWTLLYFELIGSVILHVDYITPVDKMRVALDDILANTLLWDGKTKQLAVIEAKEQSIELRILVSAKDSTTLWDLRCYVREEMIAFLQKNYPDCLPKKRLTVNKS